MQFRVCNWDLFSPIQISTCPIDRTLSLSRSPFATRRILFLDSSERASARASEQGWQRRWIEINGRLVPHLDGRGQSAGRLDATVVQCHPSPINRRLSLRDSGDALMMMLTAFTRVIAVNSACEDHSLKLAKTLISQEQDEHGRRRER